MTLRPELIDELLKEYRSPDDLTGEGGIFQQLTKALIERCLSAELDTHLAQEKEGSQDGFFIAEMDMQLRGPGEVMGRRQSRMPDFALASLVDHREVLILARTAAEQVIAEDATLDRWALLKAEMEERYRKIMGGAIWT